MDIRKTQALSDILKDKSLLKDKCYIDGKWLGAAKSIDVTNPVNESVIGSIPYMGTAETRQAIEAAERAQKDWAKKTAKERSGILRKWFTLMMENQEDLAQIMTAEQGKPLAEVARRNGLWRLLHRILRRGSPPHLRRDHSVAISQRPHGCHQAARGRRRRDHPVELPQCDDHPQGRTRTGGRLRLRLQARFGNAAVGPGHCRTGRIVPAFLPACFP